MNILSLVKSILDYADKTSNFLFYRDFDGVKVILQAINPDITQLITSCRNVISIEHTASAAVVVFRLVLLVRERKNFIRLS